MSRDIFVIPKALFTGFLKLFLIFCKVIYTRMTMKLFTLSALFTATILIVLFFQIFLSQNTMEFLLRTIFFVITVVFGAILMQDVFREKLHKEKIERLAQELEGANMELRNLDQAKSEFITIASHQLRTPLSSIKGYSSMLLEGGLGKISVKTAEVLTKIAASTDDLIRLVDDLLNLSRMETSNIRYEKYACNFAEILESIIVKFQAIAKNRGLALKFENNTKESPNCLCDKDKIEWVFTNLMDNALKYTKEGEVVVSLAHILRGEKMLLQISIRDQGIGIRKEDQQRIFIKFERTSESRHINPNGLGLGLYFARKVIEDHGGRIWVESEGAGKGSTFFVELPVPP